MYTQADSAQSTLANDWGATNEERKALYQELAECEVGSKQWLSLTMDIVAVERCLTHIEEELKKL